MVEPEMAENTVPATTATTASRPGTCAISRSTPSITLRARPVWNRTSPMRMKSGIGVREKLSTETTLLRAICALRAGARGGEARRQPAPPHRRVLPPARRGDRRHPAGALGPLAPRDAVGAGRGRAAHPQGPDRPHLLDRWLPHALRCRVAEAVAPALAAEPDRAARARGLARRRPRRRRARLSVGRRGRGLPRAGQRLWRDDRARARALRGDHCGPAGARRQT